MNESIIIISLPASREEVMKDTARKTQRLTIIRNQPLSSRVQSDIDSSLLARL
jgi:hypothetical protein